MPYVSVTSLRLRKSFYAPVFWWHAVQSFRAAERAEGALSVATWQQDGCHCTLTTWQSFAAMRAYVRSPIHAKAVQAFSRIATGRTYGFEADGVPDRGIAFDLVQKHGRVYD